MSGGALAGGQGALGGAGTGAALGSVVPGIGTGLGAGLGALAGGAMGIMGNNQQEQAAAQQQADQDLARVMAEQQAVQNEYQGAAAKLPSMINTNSQIQQYQPVGGLSALQ